MSMVREEQSSRNVRSLFEQLRGIFCSISLEVVEREGLRDELSKQIDFSLLTEKCRVVGLYGEPAAQIGFFALSISGGVGSTPSGSHNDRDRFDSIELPLEAEVLLNWGQFRVVM
eukprot:GHVN01017076.1.p2 GENE.GHVN01017076.1~~GHVN01017076.1.p2  ORF type:complete len:115 (+),score=10.92 GHVN01017076.1:570-914(+)